MVTADQALLELLGHLQARHYHFTAVTPETHSRVLHRRPSERLTLRDIFGWNRPFQPCQIEQELFNLLRRADALEWTGDDWRSRLRVASLGNRLFLHSSFPTTSHDSVFFGPDTYRFANFVLDEMRVMPTPRWIVDMGAGTGAVGIVSAALAKSAKLSLIDINPQAARLAQINACFADVVAEVAIANRIPDNCDLIIANPPYLIDGAHRIYRDGGRLFGGEVAVEWARQALAALTPGGTLLLYTGAAVIEGASPLVEELERLAANTGATLTHRELDPDVFGEELDHPQYSNVERISVLGITLVGR